MKTILQFAALGFGTGAIYALLASGIVAIYRGSGILNLAHGAYATVGAFSFYELSVNHGWPFAPAFVVSIAFVAALGAATHVLILRPLRNASGLIRLIATLGVLSVIQGALLIYEGPEMFIVPRALPDAVFHVAGIRLPANQVVLFAIAACVTLALDALSRFTKVGLATTAVAENQRAAAALGWSPDLVAVLTWSLGAALAAVAGILIVPFTGLQVNTLTLIVIAAMAAALLGSFSSFYLTLVAGVGIGVFQSEVSRYAVTGLADSVPFFLIMLILVTRGTRLPIRGHVTDRLPRLGSGIPRMGPILVCSAALIALMLLVLPVPVTQAFGQQAAVGLVLLSIVVVTGLAGQLSLGQFALAGMGALFAGRVAQELHWPFEVALLIGVVGAAALGALFALPALRTRGVSLAVVTLGLGLAVQEMVLFSSKYTGGLSGTPVGTPYLFGIDISYIEHPERYAIACVVAFVLASLAVANVRRGRAGRRLVAIRTNERAASALGISVFESKVFAFTLSSALAGLGGVFIGFRGPSVVYSSFDPVSSINAVGYAVIGGIGFVTGPIVGSGFAAGGIGSYLVDRMGVSTYWLMLAGGLVTLQILLQNPNGLIESGGPADPLSQYLVRKVRQHLAARAARKRGADRDRALDDLLQGAAVESSLDAPRSPRASSRCVLELRDVSVTFRGVVAVDQLSLEVRSGEVVGLIGPNGAGKTTAIDAVTGYTPLSHGSISFNGATIDRLPVHRRARLGISRSFQSLELFEDLAVYENLLAASDPRDRRAYVTNLVHAGRTELSPTARAAIKAFDLAECLTELPSRLPYGRRRLVAIARALATDPDILLLDEPAAGLDTNESAELTSLIRWLAAEWGIGILLVEHDMSVVMNSCDRVAVIDFGRKIAEGTPDQISSDPYVVAAYLGEPREPIDEALWSAGAPDPERAREDVR